ncbi:hypothetical protein V1525DRAFT_117885 [Lipomyces kononenkoae]|uniref:Uncharacterized protein n=1 Tax=Lipomyces kononenkoae TaxID=34357 RepID=A0ACC3T3Z7_LIPKO
MHWRFIVFASFVLYLSLSPHIDFGFCFRICTFVIFFLFALIGNRKGLHGWRVTGVGDIERGFFITNTGFWIFRRLNIIYNIYVNFLAFYYLTNICALVLFAICLFICIITQQRNGSRW